MKKNRFLRGFFLVVLVVASFTNCSNNDDKNSNNENSFTPRMTLKINDIDYKESIGEIIDGHEPVYTISWKKTEQFDGSFQYSIYGFIKGTNNYEYVEAISFDLGSNIQANQVFDGTNKNFSFYVNFLDKRFDFEDGVTTGQLKITYFDGKTMSGEFYFNKLKSDYVSMPFISISKGVFKNIPNELEL